ncbi:unnamed protein product [Heterobilharzia americana]|nr:unnamed protein product [Heterobilharzia americana]CAH8486302.1 unnamed protein product [Heterobilharzia americana]
MEMGHKINCDGTKVLQKVFRSYQERLTAEALHIWVNPDSLNRRDRVQLAASWQLAISKQKKSDSKHLASTPVSTSLFLYQQQHNLDFFDSLLLSSSPSPPSLSLLISTLFPVNQRKIR